VSLFSSLSTSQSGLQVSQTATSVISNNIANAENNDYTRQRVNITQKNSIVYSGAGGAIGTGAESEEIIRVHNEFTFARYRNAAGNESYNGELQKTLQEIAGYFPDIADKGIQRDLNNYFETWQKLASNPADSSQKVTLAQSSVTLSKSLNDVSDKLNKTQKFTDEQLVVSVNEINRLAEQIAEINEKIGAIESTDYFHANDLRDERDKLEVTIKKLVDANVTKTGVQSFSDIDSNQADYEELYSIEIAGRSIVDRGSFRPLVVEESRNSASGLNEIFFKSRDHKLTPISESINGGKVGALLDLRGRNFSPQTGKVQDGILPKYTDFIDVFSRALIQNTNNIYARSATSQMTSNFVGDTKGLTTPQASRSFNSLFPDIISTPAQKGTLTISTYDLTGLKNQKELHVNVDPENQSLNTILDEINKTFKSNDIDATARFEQGTYIIETGGENGKTKVSAALIQEDTTLITELLDVTGSRPLQKVDDLDIPFDILDGTFDIGIFDDTGTKLSTRTITINKSDIGNPLVSTLHGIAAQINMSNLDDNSDNDLTNDIDDLISAKFVNNQFLISTKSSISPITFNITDKGTGFAGALGLTKFFEGQDASDIKLNKTFANDPAKINAYAAPVDGDNAVANDMLQLQFDDVHFFNTDGTVRKDTLAGGYKFLTSTLAEETHAAEVRYDTSDTLLTTIKAQQDSISRVSVDEELTNLIRFQTGYSANAKVIQTIQQMLDTLLTIKQ
jgi:flagellar hook-associated protein 1